MRYPKETGTADERKARAADAMTKYRIKRGMINALEKLDCVADAEIIATIATFALRKGLTNDFPN